MPRNTRCSQIKIALVTLVLLGTVAVAKARPSPTDGDADWKTFKERFNKNYDSPEEDNFRRQLRAQTQEFIRQHNAGGKSPFTLGENRLADLTRGEYEQLLGYRSQRSRKDSPRSKRSVVYLPAMPTYRNTVNVTTLPATVNWTAQGWVGPVQDQGQCGSCYTYSTAGSLEGQLFNVTGQFVELSEQNLIDCTAAEGNLGCDGGSVEGSFWYVQQNGIESLKAYPDTSDLTATSNETCMYNSSLSVMNIISWRDIEEFSETALQQAVALVGPVSVAIDASSVSFQYYSGGVYSNSLCAQLPEDLDHAVLVVGYGVYNGADYWLIKNSWGLSWGINGYMMMARNAGNMCGIATDATFPVAGWTAKK